MPKLFVAVIMACAVLGITNPGEEAYAEWAAQKIVATSCQQPQSPNCYALASVPRGALKMAVRQYSYRQNFMLFSYYTTDFAGQKERRLGVVGYFL
jgi:hypothetical protein